MAASDLLVDWRSDFSTGMGYNTLTGHLCSIRTVNVAEDNEGASKTASITNEHFLVESDETFEAAMNASLSVSSGYCGIGMSASASFMMSMDINRKTSAIVQRMYWRDEHMTLTYSTDSTELSMYAKYVLEHEGPKEFHHQFGDCFIGGFYQGGECFAGYRMEFDSVEEKMAAKTAVEASYTTTNASASFETDLNSRKVNCSKELTWHSVGYPSGKLPKTKGTWEEAVEFMAKIDTSMGNKILAVLVRYDSLDSYSTAVGNYNKSHPYATPFEAPHSELPGSGVLKDFNKMYARLSLVGNQLAHMVKIGLIYDNPGDIKRQSYLLKINDFTDRLLKRLAPGHLRKAEKEAGKPKSLLRQLQAEGERLCQAARKALNKFDGTVIELWNVSDKPWPSTRGDLRVSLEGFCEEAGLVLYSAGPKPGDAPGLAPIEFGTDIDLASKFKVWVADNNYFTLQVLGVTPQTEKPIFIGLGNSVTEPFGSSKVVMRQLAAWYERNEMDAFQDGTFATVYCLRSPNAGNGKIFLTHWEAPGDSGEPLDEGPYHIRVAPAAGTWAPTGGWVNKDKPEATAYWLVGLDEQHDPKPPRDWLTDYNTQWQMRSVDDSAGVSGRYKLPHIVPAENEG